MMTSSKNLAQRGGLSRPATFFAAGIYFLALGALILVYVTNGWGLLVGASVGIAVGAVVAILTGLSSLVLRFLSKTGGRE